MRFEEVLPKMRDEGRVGILFGSRHTFDSSRNFVRWEKTGWRLFEASSAVFTSDEWSLEPIKVRKSCWSFGTGPRLLSQMLDPCTEEEATKMRIEQGFEWKEEIVNTRIYEEGS